jgi:hypothetical protein
LPFIIIYCWNFTEKKFKALSSNLPYSAVIFNNYNNNKNDNYNNNNNNIDDNNVSVVNANNLVFSSNDIDSVFEYDDNDMNFDQEKNNNNKYFKNKKNDLFTENFLKQKEIYEEPKYVPLPYRINNVELFNRFGFVNEVYHDCMKQS